MADQPTPAEMKDLSDGLRRRGLHREADAIVKGHMAEAALDSLMLVIRGIRENAGKPCLHEPVDDEVIELRLAHLHGRRLGSGLSEGEVQDVAMLRELKYRRRWMAAFAAGEAPPRTPIEIGKDVARAFGRDQRASDA